jgi:hypothetical protein
MKKLKLIRKSKPFYFQMDRNVKFNGSNMIQLAVLY